MIRQFNFNTVTKHKYKPSYLIGVQHDNLASLPYFKYFNRSSWHYATKVAEIQLISSEYVNEVDSNHWKLGLDELKVLIDCLNSKSAYSDCTNWQYLIFTWDAEADLLQSFPCKYNSKLDAFLDGYYDDIDHPSYMKSDSPMPDYYQLVK